MDWKEKLAEKLGVPTSTETSGYIEVVFKGESVKVPREDVKTFRDIAEILDIDPTKYTVIDMENIRLLKIDDELPDRISIIPNRIDG